jgi:hypothetical protein
MQWDREYAASGDPATRNDGKQLNLEWETQGDLKMDQVTLIRVVASVLFVIVLGVLVQRRRTRAK